MEGLNRRDGITKKKKQNKTINNYMAIIARLLWMLVRAVLWCLIVEVVIELVHRWLHRQDEKRAEEGKGPLFESGIAPTPILDILGNHPNPVPEYDDYQTGEDVDYEPEPSSETPSDQPAPHACTSIIPHDGEARYAPASGI